jgi:alpha-L-fucosidase 2
MNPSLTLWYDAPAKNWNEALPVGNGRLGAMVFGGAQRERLQLNEETFGKVVGKPPGLPARLAHAPRCRRATARITSRYQVWDYCLR